MKMIRVTFFLLLLPLLMTRLGSSRTITENWNLKSDGVDNTSRSAMVELDLKASTVTCEPTYGFLPCTTELWGQLFLIVVYQVLLSLAQQYVSAGSDLFFQIVGPGVFGTGLFHVLGAIPEILLVLMSGLSGSSETAAVQATMGMSSNAGSAVMNLTLIWGACVAFGSYDLSQDSAVSDVKDKRPISLTGFGVITDVETSYTARIMILSMIPFVILQLATILHSSSATHVIVLVSFVVTLALFVAYSFYQAFEPWIQNRRFEYVIQKFVHDKLLNILTRNGKPNIQVIKRIFHEIDKDKDAYISEAELRMLILGLQIDNGLNKDDYVEKVMEAFDISGDARIGQEEFIKGIIKWISLADQSIGNRICKNSIVGGTDVKNSQEEQQTFLVQRKQSQSSNVSWWTYIQAAFLVVLGTAMLALLVRPLIQSVAGFATAANIPSFFIPYVVIPVAMNYGRALSVIKSARQKTQTAISLTLSQMYGGAFTNNVIGLTIFLALTYFRNLPWGVAAEVLVVLIIGTMMGLFASFCTKIPLWTSLVAFLLYPLSLLLLYVLTSVLGW